MAVMRNGARAVSLMMSATLLLAACRTAAPASASRVPPPPPTPRQSLGASEPPVIWLGGTLDDVTSERVVMLEDSGSKVSLNRLAGAATSFYRVSGGAWTLLATQAPVAGGQRACIEALLDGTVLFALRVFLGAGCGPA